VLEDEAEGLTIQMTDVEEVLALTKRRLTSNIVLGAVNAVMPSVVCSSEDTDTLCHRVDELEEQIAALNSQMEEILLMLAQPPPQNSPPPDFSPPPPVPSPPPLTGGCSNECAATMYINDGDCDDGGSGSEFSECPYASDCEDCGERPYSPPPSPPLDGICEATCPYEEDGDCDDGGDGATYSECSYGTDCADCGVRDFMPPPPAN
jgi:hypothetical protein